MPTLTLRKETNQKQLRVNSNCADGEDTMTIRNPDYYLPDNIRDLQNAKANATAVITSARKVPYQGDATERRWLVSAIKDRDDAFEQLCRHGLWPEGRVLQAYWCACEFLELQMQLIMLGRNPADDETV